MLLLIDHVYLFVKGSLYSESEHAHTHALSLSLSPPNADSLCYEECFALHGHVISLSCRNTISACKKSPTKTQRSAFVVARGPNSNDSALSLNRISLHRHTIRHSIFVLLAKNSQTVGSLTLRTMRPCHSCLSCILWL